MKLYYIPGACSLATRISLLEVGQSFEDVRVDNDTKTTEDGEDFLSINPLGYVPVLQFDDGDLLTENSAILSYLAEVHPSLGGSSLIERARIAEALSFLSSELHHGFGPLFKGVQGEERTKVLAALGTRIDHVERQLSDGRQYLLGDDFSVADAYAFAILNWSKMFGLSLADWPTTQAFMQRMARRPAIMRALEEEGLLQAAA